MEDLQVSNPRRSFYKFTKFVEKSFFKDIFTYYRFGEYHSIFSWVFTLFYGYFFSQSIKLSPLIKGDYYQRPFSFIYEMLSMIMYSTCIYYLSGLSKYRLSIDSLMYWIPYILSILCFSLLGEISWLRNVTIVWGFWNKLEEKAIAVLSIFLSVMIILFGYHIYKAYKNKILKSLLFLPLSTVLIYTFFWILVKGFVSAKETIVHLHHAFLAINFSFWFTQWNNYLTFILHAICLGIWVQGINFYGMAEIKIFVDTQGGITSLNLSNSIIIVVILSLSSLISLVSSFCIFKTPLTPEENIEQL